MNDKDFMNWFILSSFAIVTICGGLDLASRAAEPPRLGRGMLLNFGGKSYAIRQFDLLSYVEDEYSKRFRFHTFSWPNHPGAITLELRTVNRFGLTGPISTIELTEED